MTNAAAITDDQIRALLAEAGAAGDSEMVEDCRAALEGDEAARARCAEAIADARAQDDALTAERRDDTWTVVDPDGGRWWPSDEAEAEIGAAADPGVAAVRIARDQPMRGTWHQ